MLPIDMANITALALVFARMSGFVLMNPIFSRRNVPSILKAGIILSLSFLFYAALPFSVPEMATSVEYMVVLTKEFVVGFTIGFIMNIFSSVIIVGGELIDFQIGIAMAKVFDSQTNMSIALSASFYNVIFMFLFFSTGAHLNLIRLVLDTSMIIPYGNVVFGTGISAYVIDVFCQMTLLAVKFALPIISVGFMLEIGVGILMKIIPQINIFVVNIQLKLLVGLCMMLAFYTPFIEALERLIILMFAAIEGALPLMG